MRRYAREKGMGKQAGKCLATELENRSESVTA